MLFENGAAANSCPSPAENPGENQVTATATEAAAAQDQPKEDERPKPKPGRKRKVAMHMAYLGAGYHGMQRNPGCPTIEAELESALVKMGAISEQNAGSFMKIHWMRAARTDKGVSAACQVVSAKLVVDPAETFAERVNALLPKQIRVFGVQRATDGFDARKFCDKRKYEYILPAWAFDPSVCTTGRGPSTAALKAMAAAVLAAQTSKTVAAEPAAADSAEPTATADTAAAEPTATVDSASAQPAAAESAAAEGDDEAPAAVEPSGKAVDDAGDDVSAAESAGGATAEWAVDEGASSGKYDQARLERLRAEVALSKAQYKFGPAQLERLNSILQQFVGTHNFHNYTVRVAATDPAARRFIRSFDATLVDINGEPWVKLVVVGQSFMLHQIRKMIGTALAVMRGVAAPECIALALDPDRDIATPMAPALGLFLDETYYDAFNKKFGHLHGHVTFEPFRAAAEQFKAQVLYPHIASTDAKELINALWLRCCDNTTYKFTKWAVWKPVRNIGAKARAAKEQSAVKKAERQARFDERQQQGDQQQQVKRPAGGADAVAADAAQPAAKQQRLERPGRLDGATAPMVVGMQETYGMAPHRDTEQAAAARKELQDMRREYDEFLQEEEQQQQQQQRQDGQQQQQQDVDMQPAEPAIPQIDAEEALDSLYDLV